MSKFELERDMTVSTYDRVNAGLISSILTFGFVMVLLLLVFLTSTRADSSSTEDDFPPQLPATSTANQGGSELAELDLEDEFPIPESTLSLESVSAAVSTVLNSSGKNSDAKLGDGFGDDKDRDREPSPVPVSGSEANRWLISYEAQTRTEYTRQLDYFGIEIGVIQTDSNEIIRIGQLHGSPSVTVSNRQQENQTLRFSHRKLTMKRWDKSICQQLDLDTQNSLLCQFYPESTREIIRRAEAEALAEKGRKLSDVRQTILKVQPSGGGFEFVVLDFNYHL